MTEPHTDLRCSIVTQGLGERPAGSAGGAERYLLVELPLPWPKKIDQHPLVAEVMTAPTGDEAPMTTLLGIRSTDATELGLHRVIAYDRRQPFNGFERREYNVPTSELPDLIARLRAPALGELREMGDDGLVETEREIIDVLICTHGSRDRCCGQMGTRLHAELDCVFEPNARLWRASHTGGHRFAPTGIVFPTGDTWAYLDAALAKGVVEQTIDTTELAAHYRGNVGITGRPAQIVDGLAFIERGWPWLREPRMTSSVVEDIGDSTTATEVTASVVSASGRLDATMVEEDPVPVPTCGEVLELSVKSTPQYLVTDTHWA